MTIWIIMQYWPGGKQVFDSAYRQESAARARAGELVGKDGALVSPLITELKDCDAANLAVEAAAQL